MVLHLSDFNWVYASYLWASQSVHSTLIERHSFDDDIFSQLSFLSTNMHRNTVSDCQRFSMLRSRRPTCSKSVDGISDSIQLFGVNETWALQSLLWIGNSGLCKMTRGRRELRIFSRGHATLHLAVSVGPSEIFLNYKRFFCATAPAEPSETRLPCIRPCWNIRVVSSSHHFRFLPPAYFLKFWQKLSTDLDNRLYFVSRVLDDNKNSKRQRCGNLVEYRHKISVVTLNDYYASLSHCS